MSGLVCKDERRRDAVRGGRLNGLDYVEVDADDRRRLTVTFLAKAPERIARENVVVLGGRRIRDLRVVDLEIHRHEDEAVDDGVTVTVDRPGDQSTYRLCLREADAEGRPTDRPLAGFDVRYACVDFTFSAGCPSDLDCAVAPECPPEPLEAPELHYLAKDYASFRQLILDRLSLVMPEWRERHVPDLGITLVELLAYAGDHLSYHQDAVGTEAYLDTARERISVRRHARLVDYVLHEGCNARAWVTLETSQAELALDPETFWLGTTSEAHPPAMVRAEELEPSGSTPDRRLVFEPLVRDGADVVVRAARNEIRIHTWGDFDCCLPRGTTCADLVDPGEEPEPSTVGAEPEGPPYDVDQPTQGPPPEKPRPDPPPRRRHGLDLRPCDVLIFEEVKGPRTGDPADADPRHRHAVRLTHAEPGEDPLTGQLLWHVVWGPEDALPFPVCVSATGPAPECAPIHDVTVVRGNVLLVDHGERRDEKLDPVPGVPRNPPCCDPCEPSEVVLEPGPYRPVLDRPDLTHRDPLPPCRLPRSCGVEHTTSAAASLRQDPRLARPDVVLHGMPAGPDGTPAFDHGALLDPTPLARALPPDATEHAAWLRGRLGPDTLDLLDDWHEAGRPEPLPTELAQALVADLGRMLRPWTPAADLLDCAPGDRRFVVEVDDERRARLRFATSGFGCRPGAGTSFQARYRIGNGTVGNVGAESIRQIVFRTAFPSGAGLRARNPLPAVGGTDPEDVRDAKAYAPHAFRRVLRRAVTADDYARIVMRDFSARVQRAAATLRWTGSNAEVLVAVDPFEASDGDPRLLCEIERHLADYRRIGHDVEARWARRVSLLVALTVCVRPGYLRGHVKAALLEALGSRRRRDGGLGFFHPDALSFGTDVQASEIVARAHAVEGVESVHLDRLERLYEGPGHELEEGVLRLGPLEVARMDNDASRPEHGRLELRMEGGR